MAALILVRTKMATVERVSENRPCRARLNTAVMPVRCGGESEGSPVERKTDPSVIY
ncbi:Hypothetical predicted protein [Pelobates cultripes]|uniref:Uncharacterized protein n=1 Tax=Pelobates cultripes TaxID=61616 RepID=A0AAD1T5E6_PELCU|nr:Hypothetical predicted protein [Pelobates cultripes]